MPFSVGMQLNEKPNHRHVFYTNRLHCCHYACVFSMKCQHLQNLRKKRIEFISMGIYLKKVFIEVILHWQIRLNVCLCMNKMTLK